MKNFFVTPKNAVKKCFIGFDGFVDSIISLVEQREDACHFTTIDSISKFSQKIANAEKNSCNIECIVKKKKIGGNAPIFCNSLLSIYKHDVTLMGMLGAPSINPIFSQLAKMCSKVISLSECPQTDAFEFSDGKILFGKHEPIFGISSKDVIEKMSVNEWINEISSTDLLASLNWTMLPFTNDIWEFLTHGVLPKVKFPPIVFVDFADPQKRPKQDISRAMEILKKMGSLTKLIISLNWSESLQLCDLVYEKNYEEKMALNMAHYLMSLTNAHNIVIHNFRGVTCCSPNSSFQMSIDPVNDVKIATGAGDNFNGGFSFGILHEYSAKESSIIGSACARCYVKNGFSPSLDSINKAMEKVFWKISLDS